MMHLFWVVLLSMHPHTTLSTGQDHCSFFKNGNPHNVSPLLNSLQCHNDYESYIYCKWREHGNTTLQLWLPPKNKGESCVPDSKPLQDGTVQCRIKYELLAIGMNHTFFFFKNETQAVCSSGSNNHVHLSQQLRARPPVDLSTRDTGDRGRWISWSNPYAPSSSLSKRLTYQLSYKTDGQDHWTTQDVTNTSVKLDKQLLVPGHRYEAKVRTRASVGQWSDWTPVVTWKTQEDTGQPPSLHCVLEGEREVTCSWEVSRELDHFISYQLACQHEQATQSETCCEKPTVTADLGGTRLRYSCSLTNTDPEHLLLELLPTRNAKTFEAYRHIRPKPPQNVKLREKDSSWVVEWTKPSTPLDLYYQVCFYRTHNQRPCTCVNTSIPSLTIPEAHLVPAQDYQVKVRSLVSPGGGSIYEGIPSEWTNPEKWTSYPATWSITNFVYFLISVFVAVVFLMFYCTFPTCRRRVIRWVESVPSPGKSKILSEIKSATSWTLMQSEDTSICKVLHFGTLSTCSSHASLWPMKDTDEKCLEPDEGVWNCDNLPSPTEKVNGSDTSSMSFSGPYIFCQTSQAINKKVDAKCEEEVKEEKTSSDDSPCSINFALYGEGYVCLPNRSLSRSTQDLVSHSNANKISAEQNQQRPDNSPWTGKTNIQPDLSKPTSRDQPPAYTSGPFSPWPQGGHIQASGYCRLPQPK